MGFYIIINSKYEINMIPIYGIVTYKKLFNQCSYIIGLCVYCHVK